MAYEPRNPNGQATMANSEPVVIASDQSAVPVSAASLPLPSGAATGAKQDTGNTSLASIDTKIPALGQALAAASVPVVLTAAQLTTLTPPAAITGYALESGGNLADIAASSNLVATYTSAISGLGDALQYEDDPSSNTDRGLVMRVIRKDTPANTSDTDGDYESLQMSAGRLWTSTTVTGTVAVTDNSGSLTVDAPVGTPVFVRLSDGASAISTLPVSLASVPSHAVTNAGTFVVQENGAALTSLQLIDDIVYTDDTSTHSTGTSKGALIMAAAAPTDTAVNANDIGAVGMTVNRELYVSLTTALPAGTNGIGKLTSNSGVTIGAVEIAASQTLGTLTTLTGGGVAHDGADSGNPVKIGARAASTLSDDTMVANADRTDAVSDLDGTLIVRPNYPLGDVISERTSNTDGASTASTNFGATASTRNCITGYHVFRTDAGTTPIYIDFRDGTGGSVLWSAVIPPNGGSNSPQYSGPCLFRTSANTALAYDVSAATTTVYINVTGFKSKV